MLKSSGLAAAIALALSGAAWAETVEVQMLNLGEDGERMVFEPAYVAIQPGDTVKFIATDRGHNAELIEGLAPEGYEGFAGRINEEIEITFDGEGLYGVMCKPHYSMGMVMTIAVGEPEMAAEDFLVGRIPPKAKERFEAQLEDAAAAVDE